MSKRLDYLSLVLNGDHFRDDSFSLTMQAAAKLFGVDVDYETICALSTNAFAPGLRVGEPCDDSWRMQGKDRAMHIVAAYLGLEAQPLPRAHELSEVPPRPQDAQAMGDHIKTYFREPYVPIIREALENGEAIVVGADWEPATAFWCEWGIVLDAHGDGTICGASTNGRTDCRLAHLAAWRLRRAEGRVAQSDADLAMLQRAVRRIHGEPPFVPFWRGTHQEMAYGLAAMDAWIERMGRQFLGSATAISTTEGAKVAARYLKTRRDAFPPAAGEHLDAAAAHYDQIAVLLAPAIEQELFKQWHTAEDIGMQKKYARTVLADVKTQLASAADRMAQALLLAKVKRVGEQTTLVGFPTRTDCHVRGFGELLALRDCLTYLGVDVDWTDLLGFSGDAFSCDGMTDLAHLRSHDVAQAATQSYGFELTWGFDNSKPSRPQVHELLMRGIPIVACGAKLSPQDGGTHCAEWTVIIGDDAAQNRHLLTHGLEDHCWALATYNWFGRIPWATGANVRRDGDGVPFYWQPLSGFHLSGRTGVPSASER